LDGRDRLGFPSGESSDGTSQGASLESAHQNYSPHYTPKGKEKYLRYSTLPGPGRRPELQMRPEWSEILL